MESFEPENKTSEMLPDYKDKTFADESEELNFLQRLQTNEELDGIKWSPEYAERSMFLENKKNNLPSEEQKNRFYELTKMQAEGGSNWTPELQEEVAKLYVLMDNLKNKK